LVGAGVVAAIALGGGSSPGLSTVTDPSTAGPSTNTVSTGSTTTTRTRTTVPVIADVRVPAASQSSLVGAGGALFVTRPGGRIARLDGRTLRQLAVTEDAAKPRALAVLGRTLVVADDHTILWLRASTLVPVGASAFGPRPTLGGGGRAPLVVAAGHRVCLLGASALGACVDAPFSVTAVGAGTDGTVLAVDGTRGRLATFTRAGKRLNLRGEISLGTPAALARGPVLVVGSRAYVPVAHGLAFVDLKTRRVQTTVTLPQTPGGLALVGSTIVAPLAGPGSVALVPTSGTKATRTVATGPLASTATAGAGSLAYVANARDGTITFVDVAKGKALRRVRVAALRARPVARAIVHKGSVTSARGHVTVTLLLGSGAIDATGVRIRSLAIANGSAQVELWQGGIASALGRVAGNGVTATVRPAPGRLIVRLSTAAGDFTALTVARAQAGRAIVLTLTPKPVVQTHTTTQSTGGGGGGTPTNSTPTHTTPATTHTTTPPSGSGGIGNF
ncbi:MAG: hypothetical protein ABI317_12850, partial [Gaiellales bacterium]